MRMCMHGVVLVSVVTKPKAFGATLSDTGALTRYNLPQDIKGCKR